LFRVAPTRFSSNLFATSRNSPAVGSAVLDVVDARLTPCRHSEERNRRHFHHSTTRLKEMDRREMIASAPRVDEGTMGEKLSSIDNLIAEKPALFPDPELSNRLYGGVRFADLPIINIKASPNNTIISLTNAAGVVQMVHSCGMEGFKNTREGTNIAAQATAITLASNAVAKKYQNVRVTVRGLGPGRMSSIKGLTMAGLNVVSVTDVTPITFGRMPRPKKLRKL